jgi:basic membrane lipoprotein Med (substrate-binding protein (PBP1-ABC) superfamily)
MSVALLTPGSISDQAWNGAAYEGLQRIRDSLGARISHIEVKTPSEFEENFRQYGAQGYRLVIGHGAEFQDAAMRVAKSSSLSPGAPKRYQCGQSVCRMFANGRSNAVCMWGSPDKLAASAVVPW